LQHSVSAETRVARSRRRVLRVLTDPRALKRCSPHAFDYGSAPPESLSEGDELVLRAHAAGHGLELDATVERASLDEVRVSAAGPVAVSAEAELQAAGRGATELCVRLELDGRHHLSGEVLAAAGATALGHVFLTEVLRRIRAEAEDG
jgi:hypothetical protein